jgi:hypothetical protein
VSTRRIGWVLLLPLAACKSEPQLPTYVEETDFVQFLAVEACRDAFDCSCPDLRWDTPSDCREEQSQRRTDEMSIGQAAGLTYDGECVVEIILRARDLECEYRLGEDATDEQVTAATCPEPCKPYYGDKARGEPCSRLGVTVSIDDCAQGLLCSDERICEPLCSAQSPLAVGEACEAGAPEARPCTSGSYCNAQSLMCEVPPALGEACQDRCADGSWCDRAPESPVCVSTLETGEACVLGEACSSGVCEDDVCAPPAAFVCPQ